MEMQTQNTSAVNVFANLKITKHGRLVLLSRQETVLIKKMEQMAWILWAILGVGLIVAEIFTLGFVLFWFGIGAFVGALVGFLGFGFAWQFLAFALVSVVLTAMSRTIFVNYFGHSDENSIKTGVDALPGQIGTVTSGSKGALNEGAVKVFGSTWTAFPIDEETPLREGEKVEVVSVKGSSIYVRRISAEKGLPEWRREN
jgi:membrane protein implicated in regulation of membrane protease activity